MSRASFVDDRRPQGALFLDRICDRSDADPRKREADRDEAAGHDELRAAVVVVVVFFVVIVPPVVLGAAPRIDDLAGAGFDWDGTRYDNTCPVSHDWWHYYHEDDDDDDGDGATELVMSGGLVAIGLTFTGISIAAIANAFQEQCALGPTIIFEAGTTHPYYISPNLCTIGTHTYASKKTVRDASPRKVCRKFCEAASAAGKLALKHVQGLTCYCKRR